MAENSKIAWTDHTFNPWIGCTRVSPGCENCYAEFLMDHRYHRVEWGPGKPRSRTKTWKDPIRWNKEAASTGVRKKVFCASLADWLDDEVPTEWREDLFTLIETCRHLDWLMLTKRPENALTMLPTAWLVNPMPWVWMGTTAENQKYFDLRVPILATIPAALRWVSYEPALGPILIDHERKEFFSWLIIGGESSQLTPARPFDMAWAESAIRQCRDLGITPFMKQTGDSVVWNGDTLPGFKDKAGTNPMEWPTTIRVREFPKAMVTA